MNGTTSHSAELVITAPDPYGTFHAYQSRCRTTLGVLSQLLAHAKFCVADGQSAYVGSANLTGPGLSGQLEMGLLVHGEIAQQIEQFWTYLIEVGILVPVN